jgi:CspA family cold shock protein
MPIGICKFWRDSNGYGFIQPDDGGGQVFTHVSGLQGGAASLAVGQRVEYQTGTNPKTGRECATQVRLLEPIISPMRPERAFQRDAGVADDGTAHMELAQTAFMKR